MLRERSARAGFQVALEADGSLLIRELNDNVKLPRSAKGGMWTAPSVVGRQPRFHIRRKTDIQVRVFVCVFQYVDKSLIAGHGRR